MVYLTGRSSLVLDTFCPNHTNTHTHMRSSHITNVSLLCIEKRCVCLQTYTNSTIYILCTMNAFVCLFANCVEHAIIIIMTLINICRTIVFIFPLYLNNWIVNRNNLNLKIHTNIFSLPICVRFYKCAAHLSIQK